NPEDTGPNTTYHGSHVSGLIAAATNNGQGVAGVSWGARILPLRALSGARGTLSDVIDALRWAAGLGVTGVPPNRNPAQVINLSLGVEMPCNELPALQEALQEVNSRGVIVVVAAGNYNAEASTLSPASCPGVIVVGATEASGRRAYYSNYGTRVDLMAPGGDDRQQQWVVSTLGRDQYGRYQYGGMVGTSMAAPQVAGVVALMKSKRYSLTREEVLSILKATARPLTAEECNRPQWGGVRGRAGGRTGGAGAAGALRVPSPTCSGSGPCPPRHQGWAAARSPSTASAYLLQSCPLLPLDEPRKGARHRMAQGRGGRTPIPRPKRYSEGQGSHGLETEKHTSLLRDRPG
ncbi:S8 family serine peptidase, partial [Meiothermus taiwanensis]|uniref:S8 family serine peptidase n=1 Tax=Meiothermus taiwanensis TaxID=172827 RepID=UPI000AB0A058